MDSETADKAYKVACDLFEITRDPELVLPVMRKCADGPSIRAQAWLEGYWSHALLECKSVRGMALKAISEKDEILLRLCFERCEAGELDDIKWSENACEFCKHGQCKISKSACPKNGRNAQCEIWNEHVFKEANR